MISLFKLNKIITGTILLLLFVPSIPRADKINENNILVIKLSPSDEKAVIKNLTTKKMEVIGIGDQLGDLGIVIQILENSIVLKPDLEKGFQEIILSIEKGKQKIIKIGFKNNQETNSMRLTTNPDIGAKQGKSEEEKKNQKN